MAKYRHRTFDWRRKATCLHMARFHLRKMGRKPPPLPQIGSLLAARRALKTREWANAGDMLDAIGLERIAPAQMLLGDLAMLESEDGMGAIVVSAGSKVLGWHDAAEDMVVMDAHVVTAAWRV